MFLLTDAAVPYADPWLAPIEERIAALSRGDRHVAYVYEKPDNSTFRYRVYNMIEALALSAVPTGAAWFEDKELERLETLLDRVSVLVICRARYNDRLNRLITRARNRGIPVWFDVDDLIFDPDYVQLVLTTLDQTYGEARVWDFWFAYVGRIGATLRLCDRAIVTNAFLGARIRAFANKPFSVIPNFMNRHQLELSEAVYRQKVESGFARTGKIHVGYFSGTPTHNKDFAIIEGALARLLQTDPRVILRIVGFLELKGPLRAYQDRTEFFPLQDFVNLQGLIASTEINVIPLQDNIFTNCKSELKYFEAGAVGTVSIASPTFTLREAIADGKNGFLSNSFEWFEKLSALIEQLAGYPALAAAAHQHSVEKYHWNHQLSSIEAVLFQPQTPT